MKLHRYISLIILFLLESSWAIVDNNGNGMSDVWERKYQVVDADPSANPDGDGQNNLAESLAGTDPNDDQSILSITHVQSRTSGLFVSWQSQDFCSGFGHHESVFKLGGK